MKLKWYAHASVMLEGDGVRIITDPYTPEKSGFATITDSADIVVRSSDDDSAHANADMITGDPEVVTATHILNGGATAKGIHFTAIPSTESMKHKLEPRDNGMYRFVLDGIEVLHFGDLGNALNEEQIELMQGAELAIVPTGGPPTIELDDLYEALDILKPVVTIPMHHSLPGCKFPKMLDVTDFTDHFAADSVVWATDTEVTLTRDNLPEEPQVWVLKATAAG